MENCVAQAIFTYMMTPRQKRENFRFLTDKKGKKLGVLLSLKAYEELIEDLHDISMVLKRKDEELISFEEIKKELNVSDIP